MRFLIVAGGTGGHIYPGIAIAEELETDKKNEILFITGKTEMEKDIFKKEHFKVKHINARGILRKISYHAISAPFVTFMGFLQSIFILMSYRPKCVILTGGYVSFPVAFAAKLLSIPCFIQEQNTIPGITTKILSKISAGNFLSFEETKKWIKGEVLGNPVRKKIKATKKEAKPSRRVLIFGGSQGAKSINNEIINSLDFFKDKEIELLHILGNRDFSSEIEKLKSLYPFYRPIPYMYNMEGLFSKANLVVSRAGATAIFEILSVGLPSILVPFPYSAEGHQDYNAKAVEKMGAAEVISDSKLQNLPTKILDIINDDKKLELMAKAAMKSARPDAAEKIVGFIMNFLKKGTP